MKKSLFTLFVLASAAMIFTGCKTSRVVLLDQRVQKSVDCPGVQEMRLPDGRLKVAAQLRNREERRIQVQVNCEFKDAKGFVIDSTPYQNLFFDENSEEAVTFVSMNNQAVRYMIRVRQAR